ncbi:signal transduction histidine kinase [Duganella sp. SG902]|uniref:DAHL domain-containing protein n=1 Tax=Duganella sp. SG902 TaxID=2587016 RepID=UPI00159DCFCC|nr:DAHL domain-containing protein [Duganella sp. SG902]NVM80014.1 signal transduction histidine kinase [Duganella sp. SG902]
MRTRLRKRWGWIVLGLLAGALALMYFRSPRHDPVSYFENVALLRQIKQLDARWELDAMKSRVGLNHNYDPLVAPLPEMERLPQRLAAMTEDQPAGDGGALGASIAAYQRAHNDKAALMEAFKSHNAVLQNSRAFLRTAQEDLNTLDGHAAGQAAAIGNQVLLDTLIYAQAPSAAQALQVEGGLAALAKAGGGLDETGRERSELFTAHVRTVLRERAITDQLLASIAEAPTAARIDDISAALGERQQRAVQQLQTYRLALSLLALLLLASLALAALRLMRNHATIKRVNHQLHLANAHLEQRVEARTAELLQANGRLQREMAERKQLECRLVQTEKLASIGQLAAGIAHEINNPLAFLASNFGMLEEHLDSLFEMLSVYEAAESCIASAEISARLSGTRARIDLAYLKADLPALVAESRGGMDRVGKIVQDLKDFSHVESEQNWVWADLRGGLQSTLNLISSDLRQVADIVTDFAPVLEIECLPSQLNQVFMSMLMNAAQALGPQRGRITVRTGGAGAEVWVEISDNGHGIAPEVLPRIFDPFFSTRGIGKGTGLGLSLAYGIVAHHRGRIEVQSAPGQGSTFRVTLPISQRTMAA